VKPALNKAFAVGAVVAVAAAALLLALTFLKRGGFSERDSYLVRARFNDATGLTWKSKVQIAGIQIGEVTRISLEGAKAVLELRVKKDVPLHTDACLAKTFPSALLPDALLDASPGSESKPLLQELPEGEREITCVREAASVQKLIDSLSKIAGDVSLVTGDLAQTVNGGKGSLRDIIENLATITQQVETLVAQNSGTLTQILNNTRDFTGDLREISARDKERIHDILVNVDRLSAQLGRVAGSVQGILDGTAGAPKGAEGGPGGAGGAPTAAQQQAQGELKGVQQAVVRLNDSLAKLDEILGKVNEGKSVAGKLLVDEKLGREFSSAVEGVSDYVDRLNKMQIQLELRSEWLFNQTVSEGRPGAKVYFGAKLLPRPDKFYLLEIVSDPRGVDTVQSVTSTTQVPGQAPSTSITTTTTHQDKITFSLELGKRYGPWTFRVGVIESSGGVGTDLHLFDDALQLSLSVYQFSRPQQDVFPRAKIWANYNFLQHFYATTGVDDFLNRWRTASIPGGRSFNLGTDVFFGVGLFFTDDDLKTLMLSGTGSVAAGAAK